MGNSSVPALEPLKKSIEVELSRADAFALFTGGLGEWWPLAVHSVSRDRAQSCGIEPKVGGLVYEVRDDGERFVWGKVLAWDEPKGFTMSWHPGRTAETAQEVEVRFSDAAGGGTLVELEHRNWATYGDGAAEARKQYDGGWQRVLGEHFAQSCQEKKDGSS